MKTKLEYVFGAIAAAAGVYVAWKTSNQPAPVENVSIPPLQPYDPSASYTGPALASTTPTPPYQSYNYGPNHAQHKAAMDQSQARIAAANAGCGCNDPCKPCCPPNLPKRRQRVPTPVQSQGQFNLATISQTPQQPSGMDDVLHSQRVQLHEAAAVPTLITRYTSTNPNPSIPNVPSASSLAGYGVASGYIN
jgi:hypothetical protein